MITTSTRRVLCLAAVAISTGVGLGAADARAAVGDLTLGSGPEACLHYAAELGCADSRGDSAPKPYTFSPDGKHVYGGNLEGLLLFDVAADGRLVPREGVDGCYVDNPSDGCRGVHGQDNATDAAVSPDGKNVYATSSFEDGIVIYDRAADGTLSRKPVAAGCISDAGSVGCADGRALDIAIAVEVSPDGKTVFVASQGTNPGVSVFDRAPDGTLTQKAGAAGCLTQTGAEGCTNGRGLASPSELVQTPDGKHLYATGAGIAMIDVAADGTIAQKAGTDGCIRNAGDDGCAQGRGVATVVGLALSPDGTRAYSAAQLSSAITTFDRTADGRLVQRPEEASCLQDGTPAIDACAVGRALDYVKAPVLSPDGKQLYAATQQSDGVVVLDIGADGNPVQRPGAKGCITNAPTADCGTARGLDAANTTLMSPDGRKLYVTGTALAMFDRQVDPDPPAPVPTPEAPPAQTPAPPAATPTPSVPARPAVPVALCNRALTLLDVLPSGKTKVRVTGIARSTFAGKKVVIREGARRVGTATVARDGRFAVRVAQPARARRATARYTATLPDGTRSQAFKLKRSFTILSRKETKSGIKLVMRLAGRNRTREVRVQRQTSCTERRNVATRKIDKKGRVTFTLPRPTDPADPVANYRVRARVNNQLSFTLQVAVERAG